MRGGGAGGEREDGETEAAILSNPCAFALGVSVCLCVEVYYRIPYKNNGFLCNQELMNSYIVVAFASRMRVVCRWRLAASAWRSDLKGCP